jgi:hypothetical protein
MVFLMETKLQNLNGRFDRIKSQLGYECMFVVDSKGKSGGLALLWKDDFNVAIQNYSRRHINVVVYSVEYDKNWKFTGFYGHPDVSKRKEAWALLNHLESFSPKAWLCIWDFNENERF